ncbi:MAG: type IV pilus assembly protein FimV [Treponema sp.]
MKTLTGLDIYILTQEFPQLSLTEDTDIERYFEFRALNKHADALKIYNTRLKQKYPNEKVRILLMTYYRKKDRRFSILLTQTLAALAQQTADRIKKTIIFFVRTITPLKQAEVYTVIQVCEKVINAISKDRFAVINFSEKYVRYAEKLHFHAVAMRSAADILRMYITDTISSVREFKEEQIQQRYRKRQSKRQTAPAVDFSKITFTKAQIRAIILPPGIVRLEDQVLAYTFKYWNIFEDTAFENIVLLYSRKYRTKHYSIFQAVKTGRVHAWKDEEILHAVLANVSNGYYYNISGDLYLQRTWRQIRSKLCTAVLQDTEAADSKKKKRQVQKTRQKQQDKAKARIKKAEEKVLENAAVEAVPPADTVNAPPAIVQVEVLSVDTPLPEKEPLPDSAVNGKAVADAPKIDKEDRAVAALQSISAEPPLNSAVEPMLSIAELIKKTTGKSYGVYKELFFKTIRVSIRSILAKNTRHKFSLFGNAQNTAEKIIYRFMQESYNNPYQQWEGSDAQQAVFEEGFHITTLEDIIRHWAEHTLN